MDESSGMAVMASAMASQTFGAQVVTKTLDYMNQNSSGASGGSNADYDFQTAVLGAYTGKGTMLDMTI